MDGREAPPGNGDDDDDDDLDRVVFFNSVLMMGATYKECDESALFILINSKRPTTAEWLRRDIPFSTWWNIKDRIHLGYLGLGGINLDKRSSMDEGFANRILRRYRWRCERFCVWIWFLLFFSVVRSYIHGLSLID